VENLIPLIVALPLLAAGVLLGVRLLTTSRWLADLLTLGAAVLTTTLCILLLFGVRHQTLVYWFGGWQPQDGIALGIGFVADPAGALLASLAGVLVCGALLFSWHYFETVGLVYHSLMLLLLAALAGFSLTGDLFNLFVFFELTSVAPVPRRAFHLTAEAWLTGLISTLVALAVAWASTQTYRLPRHARGGLNPLTLLRRVHSGYIGDYVTWFMVGAAVLLAALAVPRHRP